MTTQEQKALELALEGGGLYEITGRIEDIDKCIVHRSVIKEALMSLQDGAQQNVERVSNEQDTCKGCNGNGVVGNILDTVPCPFCKGSGIESQQSNGQVEPVAWRYKPARENNPRWEYTTEHPLDMGDGYLRPSLVEYCKCIEPLYAKEKPKLMLEKFREMEDLLEEPAQQEPATKEKIREAIVFNLPLYTTPPQRTWVGLTLEDKEEYLRQDFGGNRLDAMDWAARRLKEKNT